ncbi:MAG TPA: hypothetical protein VFB90_05460, partial [Dehalococcoidia bacterium]|nr:hypothetical protein [Dehalococcoidia bacterium]
RQDIRWLEDEFRHDTPEIQWLPIVGQRGWLVITRDKKIRSRPGERQELVRANVGCFILMQKDNPTKWELLRVIVASLDAMEDIFRSEQRPFIYGVSRIGALRRIA